MYEEDNRSVTASSSLDARYAKSDPQAAIRRNTGDQRSSADILALITKTESEIKRVKSEMASSHEHLEKVDTPITDTGASGAAILSASWMTRQYSQGRSMSDMSKVCCFILNIRNWTCFRWSLSV